MAEVRMMSVVEAICPFCGYGEHEAPPGSRQTCDHCGHDFTVADVATGPAQAHGQSVWDIRDEMEDRFDAFYPGRVTSLIQVLGAGLIVLGGGYSVVKGDRGVWPLVLICLGLLGGVPALQRLFTRRPELIINARGIHTRRWQALWPAIVGLRREYRARGKTTFQVLLVKTENADYSIEVSSLSALPGTIVQCAFAAAETYRPGLELAVTR